MDTIQQGSRGTAVEAAQELLTAKGYDPGAADGIFGAKTTAAVKAFQQARGLAVDGIVGPKTWEALLLTTALRRGARGQAVTALQRQLNAQGFDAGAEDGIFGQQTEAAVRAFQQAAGLAVDGVAGPKTQTVLETGGGEPHSTHFKLSEFACHDGTAVPRAYWPNVQRLMDELERVRAVWGKPIVVNSGYRTASYNKGCGGAKGSQHLTANAADIQVQGVSPSVVYAQLDALYPNQGLGKYATFTHLDLRGYRARW